MAAAKESNWAENVEPDPLVGGVVDPESARTWVGASAEQMKAVVMMTRESIPLIMRYTIEADPWKPKGCLCVRTGGGGADLLDQTIDGEVLVLFDPVLIHWT